MCLVRLISSIFFIFSCRCRRRVSIAQGVNPESVTPTMSPEGILTIMAPKMMLEDLINLNLINLTCANYHLCILQVPKNESSQLRWPRQLDRAIPQLQFKEIKRNRKLKIYQNILSRKIIHLALTFIFLLLSFSHFFFIGVNFVCVVMEKFFYK